MARKSKAFGEILKQQRAEKTHEKELEKLQQKLQKGPWGDKVAGTVTNPKGEAKMSEVLEEFVEPYLSSIETPVERKKLFEVAVVAWNLSLMPETVRQTMIDKLIQESMEGADPWIKQDMRKMIDELIARKQKFFTQHKRYVIDFQLEDTGSGFHLSVASTLSNPFAPDSAD
ncbi:hypothetical protein NG799_19020 [Laspinema sp. D1]|uniref:Uncharacterized protein n=1 Tax=Laspinema palackyanum D2a TaxID=2953684 RepID=A0ABT2MUI4_9CYAN|nr:hypothetical protein [Laspinema sp. D2a]